MMGDGGSREAPGGAGTREFKFGDVVFANCVILHRWQSADGYDSNVYIVAVHGQLGVVTGDLGEEGITVNFHGSGESVVSPEDVSLYQGHVARR